MKTNLLKVSILSLLFTGLMNSQAVEKRLYSQFTQGNENTIVNFMNLLIKEGIKFKFNSLIQINDTQIPVSINLEVDPREEERFFVTVSTISGETPFKDNEQIETNQYITNASMTLADENHVYLNIDDKKYYLGTMNGLSEAINQKQHINAYKSSDYAIHLSNINSDPIEISYSDPTKFSTPIRQSTFEEPTSPPKVRRRTDRNRNIFTGTQRNLNIT